jgi:dihydrodipicolinate synthase/N-acetylneuraminate lyase
MNNGLKHHGLVVPMVTPVTRTGGLDEPAVDRLVDFLLAGGVDGIFVLGTTGEGGSVPQSFRRRLVECAADRVKRRAKVYAGLGDLKNVAVANDYFHAGADAVVARPPISYPLDELLPSFQSLLSGLEGPLILYNIPATTNVSIPLDVVGKLVGHPRLAGIKDSENNSERLEQLLGRFGNQPEFSVFVGVGTLMARGLKLGAEGIVPSVGNLIPNVCQSLCLAAQRGDWTESERHADRMKAVADLYQNGRTLGQSLASLKAALHCLDICSPDVLPPLVPASTSELQHIRSRMTELGLLGK